MGILLALTCLWVRPATSEAEIKTNLTGGDSTVFYDIDASSRLLEVNYEACEARVIADLRPLILGRTSCNALAYYLPWDKSVVLVQFGAGRENGVVEIIDLVQKEVRKAVLAADVAIDFFAIMLSQNNLWFTTEAYGTFSADFQSGKLDKLPFKQTSHTSFDISRDGKHAYLFPCRIDPYGDVFRVFDLSTRKLVQNGLLRQHLLHLAEAKRVTFKSFSEPYVLVSIWERGVAGGTELRVLNCREWNEVVSFKNFPVFWATTYMTLENPSSMIITQSGVKLNPVSVVEESGEIRRYRGNLTSGEWETLPEEKYNPEEEVVLKDASGNLRVFPRYRFDYVSYRDVSINQESRFDLRPPSSEEEYTRLTGELAGKFSKMVETKEKIKYGEQSYTVKHLNIKTE